MKRRSARGVGRAVPVVALVLGAGIAASRALQPAAAQNALHAWTRPNELRVAMTTEPNTLNPLLQLNDYENFVTRLAFDQLITIAADGRTLVPRLATVVPSVANGGLSRDGLTLTWHLRPGVRWHDGAPFTSRDVAFSFAAVMNPRNNVANRRGFDLVRDVRTPDAHTVVVRLRAPFAPALTQFFGDGAPVAIVPAHLLARDADINAVPFNALPIGTGPYRIVAWKRGQEIDLEAFDRFYRGKPRIARIVVRFVPDEATLVDQMRTHESDVMAVASVTAYGRLRTLPDVDVALTDVHAATTVLLNDTRPALRDVRVRRAIALALDRRALVDKLMFGAASVASANLPAFMWAHDPSVRGLPYDPEAAKRLLRAAGYVPGDDGIVAKAGRPLSLVYAYAVTSAYARAASIQLQAYLRAVGIDVVLKGYSAQQIFAGYGAGGVYQNGTFDLASYTMTLGIDPDTSGRFTCGAVPPHGQNYSRYCNAEVDAAERRGLTSVDLRSRKDAYATVERRLVADVPLVFIAYPKNVDAYVADLHGFRPNPVTASWNADEWSFGSR